MGHGMVGRFDAQQSISFGDLGFGCHWNLCMSHHVTSCHTWNACFFKAGNRSERLLFPILKRQGLHAACTGWCSRGLRLFQASIFASWTKQSGWAWGKQSSEETTNSARLSSPFAAFEQRQRIWRPLDLCAPAPIGPRTFSRQTDLFDFWGTSVRFVKCSMAQLGPFCYYKSVCNSLTDQVDRKKHGEFWRPQPCTPWDAAAFGWWCKWRPPSPKEGQRGEEDWGDWGFFHHVYDFCGLSFFMTACVASLGVSSQHCERGWNVQKSGHDLPDMTGSQNWYVWRVVGYPLHPMVNHYLPPFTWSAGQNSGGAPNGRPPKGGRPGRQRLRRSCGFVRKW